MDYIMWKKIPGYENYEASDAGEIRSVNRTETYRWKGGIYQRSKKGKVLKQTRNKNNGYLYVHLGRGVIFTVHRLVAWAFLGPQEDGMVVRHRDGNKLNNRAENLMYGSGAENYADAVGHGTMTVGEKHYNAILTRELVLEIRRRANEGEKASKIAADMGFKYPTVLAVINRKTWRSV